MGSHPVPRSFPSRSRAGGFISSPRSFPNRSRATSFYIHLVPRSFPSRSRATSFYIHLVPRSFPSRSRARSLHPFGPKILSQQKQNQVLCPVQEVQPGVPTSSWSRSFPAGFSCSSGFRSPFEEPWVYMQLVKILSLQIGRNAYAVNSDCLPQPIQRRCMKSMASYSLSEQMSHLTSRLSSARTIRFQEAKPTK